MKLIPTGPSNGALITVFCVFTVASCVGTDTPELQMDSFDSHSNDWQEIYLEGNDGGNAHCIDGQLVVSSREDARYGWVHRTPVSGHFLAEIEFDRDEHIGLALFHNKNGQPDKDNFTMLTVDTNEEGRVIVAVRDRQQGIDDVLDNTGQFHSDEDDPPPYWEADDYEHILTGTQYSVPYRATNGKLRIFHDAPAGFFHFYYAVKKNIRGQDAEGWMELVPSKNWGGRNQEYLVGLISSSPGEAVFKTVRILQKPEQDRDDRGTGFAVARREYNWSGAFGDAVVVTFGEAFDHHDRDIKFVFWSEMNYIPAWHLTNQLLFTYEFVETWGGGNLGCHEPMSDRLLRWSRVEVVEDNPVRKVVHWHYVLCDPDYKIPDDNLGSQNPEVDEYFTFYPDGTGTRYIVYTPKMDTDFREAHEVAELISIAGTLSLVRDFYDSPALTFQNLEGELQHAHPGPKFDYGSHLDTWQQMILSAHHKDLPDIYCAFSNDPLIPETYSGYNLHYQNTWQSTDHHLVHWPVNKRPFTGNYGSGGTWEGEVSHSCLVSCDIHDGDDWVDHFKLDSRDRKYRDWVMLLGTAEAGDLAAPLSQTRSWLFSGRISSPDGSCDFVENDYRHKALVFKRTTDQPSCIIEIDPIEEESVLVNPVLEIRNWGSEGQVAVELDGSRLAEDRYRAHRTNDGSLQLWLDTVIESSTAITLRSD